MSDLVERLRARKEPSIEYDMHYPQIVDSDTPDAECFEAADRIAQLEAALRFYAGWPKGPAGNIAPLLIDAGYKARAALGEERT